MTDNPMPIEPFNELPVNAVTDGSIRCLFYARYSSDNQRRASIEDQFRECRQLAESKGWRVLEHLNQSDQEKTGRTKFGRTGLDRLLAIVKTKPKAVDYVVIADTSRWGRNAAETLQLAKILKFHGVSLYFVEDGLDSRGPSFWDTFSQKAIEDERYSRSLGAKVKRGRVGRFLAGFNPGGGCYGYRNTPVFDYTKKGSYGQPFVIGVKQTIDPVTSKIVLRIFNSYAEGMSYRDIAVMLNTEGVPTSQEPRSKRKSTWSKNAIHSILENTRYVGRVFWNTTTEEFDPETGKRKKSPVPRNQWEFREDPELRIIPSELWEKAQQRRKEKAVIVGVKKSGGMSRTEASRRYILSGFLKCGMCGGKMLVVTTRPTRYGCANHRYEGTCENAVTIRQDHLEQAFLAALSDKLRSVELREELIREVHAHLLKVKSQQMEAARSAQVQRGDLEANRAELVRQQKNLLKAIRESGGRRSIYEDLDDIEARIGRIDELLATGVPPGPSAITVEEVQEFVDSQSNSFHALLAASPEKVKSEFQKRIKVITLAPAVEEGRPAYKVTGDVDLFSLSEDVKQTNQVHLIGLLYTMPISFTVFSYQKTPHKALSRSHTSAAGIQTDSSRSSVSVEDDLLAAVQRIDTDAFLRSAYRVRNSRGFAWPGERDARTLAADPFTFRDGFGGLRLATVDREPAEIAA